MAIWILEGTLDADQDAAVWVDSVTGLAFGPTFEDREEAQEFEDYHRQTCGSDPRAIPGDTLRQRHAQWRRATGRDAA